MALIKRYCFSFGNNCLCRFYEDKMKGTNIPLLKLFEICFSKYRWYEYSYRHHSGSGEAASSSGYRMPPVAQKKHHLYGKRLFQEQTTGKFNLN